MGDSPLEQSRSGMILEKLDIADVAPQGVNPTCVG